MLLPFFALNFTGRKRKGLPHTRQSFLNGDWQNSVVPFERGPNYFAAFFLPKMV